VPYAEERLKMNSGFFKENNFEKRPVHCKRLPVLFALVLLFGLMTAACAAPSTAVRIVRYADDGTTVLNETTVTYQWMEANLPVQGDGKTHYYHQGPVFVDDKEGQWDVNETTNFKDEGAVKGTDVRDLCNLVGGMNAGDEVMIKAPDGYHVEFWYENVYTPQPRQGPIVVCWYNGEETSVGERQGVGYPPSYFTGMRLVFFADTSINKDGKHVFGNNDMRAVMPPATIHLFDELYPSTSGYTVKWIDEVRVYSGGYHGTKGALAKSLEEQTGIPTTPAQKSPLQPLTCIGGVVLVFLSAGRRLW
jgi:hypothetical protein